MTPKDNQSTDSTVDSRLAILMENLKELAADMLNQSLSHAAGMLEAAILLQNINFDVMERVCKEIHYSIISDFIVAGISRDYAWSLHQSALDILADLPLNITMIHDDNDEDDNDPDPVFVSEPPRDPAPALMQ